MQRPTTSHYVESLIGGLHKTPLPRAEGILCKRRQKECKNQRVWKTPGEQGLLIQQSKVYISSQKLRQQAQTLHGLHQILCADILAINLVLLWDS